MGSDELVTTSKKIWRQLEPVDKTAVSSIAKELGVTSLFVQICFQRGLKTADQIRKFISIDETWFHDPFLMHDMEIGIERIIQAIENNEKITIYGDYDADGITATALMVETLDSIGANVDYYLPNRFVEGYGPNKEAFAKIIESGTSLIVTVDNGVTGHEAIEYANSQNVDVVVSDHHELPNSLPDAYAIIHPNHPEGNYPFPQLAGVGVALKIATALLGDLPVEVMDLAAIGTVADLVSLTDENRAIVYYGLQMITNTQRTGLIQLLIQSDREPADVDEETIAFQLAPRLNAVGRLGDASPCVELLCTYDLEKARELAVFVNEQNEKRKAIVDEMTESALQKLQAEDTDHEIVLLADESWHQGVLGIVASRIVEKVDKPTLLFSIDSATNLAKGSARSVDSINLHTAFTEISELFVQFGGHHMAAGMTAEADQLALIKEGLHNYVKNQTTAESYQFIDAYCSLSEISVTAIQEINQLKPFGTDNQKPLIACEKVMVFSHRKVGADKNHLKLTVEQENEQVDIISFQNGKISDYLFEQQMISIAGYLEINEWNGMTKPQMQMIDADIPGPVLVDERINQLNQTHFQYENVDYVFYNIETYQMAQSWLPTSAQAIFLTNEEEAESYISQRPLVIVDCPDTIKQFTLTITGNETLPVRCYFYKKKHLYLVGLPTRKEFADAYKFFIRQQPIDLKKDGHHIVKHLKIESEKLFLIVKVFLEANFVIIENGLLNVNNNPQKVDIQQTNSFKNAHQQIKAEELFLYSSFKEIIDILK